MFIGAVICLFVAVVAALCGYGGVPDVGAAALAQHVFLLATVAFAIFAVAVIAGLDQGLETLRSSLSRGREPFTPPLAVQAGSIRERN